EQDLTYGQVLFILSQPARSHIWRTLTRFSSAWVCNIRVNTLNEQGDPPPKRRNAVKWEDKTTIRP
ncbi:MAG: hypothetical protein ACERKR_05305, partial [Deltaproteobacteria bacterium]